MPDEDLHPIEGRLRASYGRLRAPATMRRYEEPPQHRRPGFALALGGIVVVGAGVLIGRMGHGPAPLPPSVVASSGFSTSTCLAATRPEDPITVAPAHSPVHDFFGNKDVSANATYEGMLRGTPVCSGGIRSTASFWTPQLSVAGGGVTPQSVATATYHRGPGVADTVAPPPADLRMRASVSPAGTPADQLHTYWTCGDGSDKTHHVDPVACANGVAWYVADFPDCWDGILTHRDDSQHMEYSNAGVCIPGSKRIVEISLTVRYSVASALPAGTPLTGSVIAGAGTISAQAVFWNTWAQGDDAQPFSLTWLVDACAAKTLVVEAPCDPS